MAAASWHEVPASAVHVKAVFTVEELESAECCLACDSPRIEAPDTIDLAEGATTLDLDGPVPVAALCRDCRARHAQAMQIGAGIVWPSSTLPVGVVVLAGLVGLFPTPIALPIIGALALLGLPLIYRRVRQKRGAEAIVLLLDAAGEDVLLQIRRSSMLDGAKAGAYRELGRTREAVRGEALERPKRARMPAVLPWMLGALTTAVGVMVCWNAAYPFVVFDNPRSSTVAVRIDGAETVFVTDRAMIQLPYGDHRLAIAGEPSFDLHLGFGQSMLVSTDPEQCYEVVSRSRSARSGGLDIATTHTFQGPFVAVEDPKDVGRASTCP